VVAILVNSTCHLHITALLQEKKVPSSERMGEDSSLRKKEERCLLEKEGNKMF
jgi:hypothetical protein